MSHAWKIILRILFLEAALTHSATAMTFCAGNGDEIHYGDRYEVDICGNSSISCQHDYEETGDGAAWVLPREVVNPMNTNTKSALTDLITKQLPSHEPRV